MYWKVQSRVHSEVQSRVKIKASSGIKRMVLSEALLATALIVSFGTSLTSTLPCRAAGEVYPVQVPAKYPKPFAAYKKIIPVAWRKASWVYTLQGTAEPVRTIDFKGRKFLLGHVCKPHDCGANQLTFLIDLDGSTAYALANSFDLTHAEDVMVGSPDPETIKVLRKGLE
ncbi:hypothetical protein BH11CYA1_BH11CYA1_16370 [soil metagenome]